MSLLAVEQLDARHGLLKAVRNVDLQVAEGEILALVGANGAGKTTLLRTIAGAHRPASGRIMFDGNDVTALSAHERVALGIALVPEGRRLFAGLTVEENLRVAGDAGRAGRWNIEALLEVFPMLKARLKTPAGLLSGGEQQATSIGRAMMTNPRLLLLDEISLGLAPLAIDNLYRSLTALFSSGTALVIVEQNLNRVLGVATRVCCMLEGRIVLERDAKVATRRQITEAYFGCGKMPSGTCGRDLAGPNHPGHAARRRLRADRLWAIAHVRRHAHHQSGAW
jgi:branched-chain amino acid transport system ATP-binding protein